MNDIVLYIRSHSALEFVIPIIHEYGVSYEKISIVCIYVIIVFFLNVSFFTRTFLIDMYLINNNKIAGLSFFLEIFFAQQFRF